MALVEKMRISGIRSYAANDFCVIEFQTPLTLIVGPNGSGKTTVIECLKYVTTGDMPPGCKNSAFIHDPKVAGEREVKGQVKLRFRDITGKRYYCTRSMTSFQKQKKIETKSLDSVIMKEVNGERVSITSRCADMNREMITRLGVSKAVLENVIFCHQEDANWPLSEGKALKQKFDDIFAATRYIKALESIRNFRKEQTQTIKEYNIDLTHLKKGKDKAEEITDELSKTQGKMEVARNEVRKLHEQITPIEAQLAELDSVSDDVFQLEKKIGNFQTMLQQLQKTASELDSNIVNKFKGTPEELMEVHSKFEERVQKKQSELKQLEAKLKSCGNDQEQLSGQRTMLLRERGKFEQEAEVHKKNIEDRDQLVVKLSAEQDIEGFAQGPFTTSEVDEFLNALKGQFQEIVEKAKKTKAAHQAQVDDFSDKIDRLTKSFHDHEGTIKHKKALLKENEQKVRQITQELSNVNASANRLQYVERELKKAEQELEEMQSGFSFSQTNEEVNTMVEEKRTLEQSLTRLREEQTKMHLQSTAQTKIDMLMKDKHSKEESIQTILNRHEEVLTTIFTTRPPLDMLRSDLNLYLQNKNKALRGISDQLQELNKQIASKDARKRLFQDQLRQKESKVLDYRSQLEEACGENDYNLVKEELQENLEKYNTHLKELGAFEKIYKKYINQLKDKSTEEKDKACPLCKRKFQSSKQLFDLIEDLNHILHNVPEKKQQNKMALDQQKKKLDKVAALAPVKANLDSLVSQDLPDLKKKVSDVMKEVDKLKTDLFGVEESKALCEGEEKVARDIEPDIRMIERYYYDLKDIDRNITLESSKLQGVTPGRTMNQVTTEIQEKQDRVDGLGRRIEQKRKQLMESQRQLSVLERNVNELKSQKLNITNQLQRRTQLEEQKADLSSANQAYEREIRDAEKQLEPIEKSLEEVREKREEVEKKKEKHQDQTRNALETIKQRGNKLREISNEITRYVNDGKETALQGNREELSKLETRIQKITNEQETVSKSIAEIQEDVARQQVRTRELEDNIKLHRTQKEMADIQKNINETKKELSKFGDYDNLSRERSSLQKKLDDYRKDKAAYEGRLKGHEDEIRRFQRELRHDYAGAEEKHRRKLIQVKTTEMANQDLDKYYKALDRAIMKFHGLKMAEINKIIKEYWINTYKGHDIDTIEIRADEEEGSGAAKARRTYNYRVVMLKGDTALDMRGRCSAGQKVLASIIIRLALAETFCLNCGILALDEPTTNLDEQNVESLANALKDIIKCRQQQRNFQLIVITHDEEFVQSLGRTDFVDYYYRVYKSPKKELSMERQQTAQKIHDRGSTQNQLILKIVNDFADVQLIKISFAKACTSSR